MNTIIYTIMPEYAGAYGWINRTKEPGLGACCADSEEWSGDHPISSELHESLTSWQREYECAEIRDDLDRIAVLEWREFHQRGITLCQQLKKELGESVRLHYVKPIEDPNYFVQERSEILADGIVVDISRPERTPFRHLPMWMPRQIVSGGQTGVDRAALDWACLHRIPHGGWCPRGRLAVDGSLAPFYQLTETDSTGYRQRTKLNVRDSDATLILIRGELAGGSALTAKFAQQMNKPYLVASLDSRESSAITTEIGDWLQRGRFETLNIAGPSERKFPRIYYLTMNTLRLLEQETT